MSDADLATSQTNHLLYGRHMRLAAASHMPARGQFSADVTVQQLPFAPECRLVPLRPQRARRKRASAERPSPEGPFPAATFKMLPKAACAGRLIGAAFSLKHA
jgi:hypothetical protein